MRISRKWRATSSIRDSFPKPSPTIVRLKLSQKLSKTKVETVTDVQWSEKHWLWGKFWLKKSRYNSRCRVAYIQLSPKFLSEISATISKILFFSRKVAKFGIFDFSFWQGRGCARPENCFLTRSISIRSKTLWQTKKWNETSPALQSSILTPSMDFWWNFMIKAWKMSFFIKL